MFDRIVSAVIINPRDSEIVKAKKIIWYSAIGSILVLFIVSWIIFQLFSFSSDKVKVPMINGDNIYEALNKLSEKNLVARVSTRFSDKYNAGEVYAQNPRQGSVVKRGRVVSFSVSLGPRNASLPDFTGLTMFELEDLLDQKYPQGKIPYKFDNPVYEFNDTVEKGRIIRQEPKDGTPIYSVKKVKFWVSNGIKQEHAKTIGEYKGKKIDDVAQILADLEVPYTYDFQIVDDKSQDMIVTDQSIGSGTLVDEIIRENKILMLKVNQYKEIDGEKIRGTYLLDLPKKPLPYLLEVKLKISNREKTILKRKIKGGVAIPVLYNTKDKASLIFFIDNSYYKEVMINIDQSQSQ
jgi:beta-lactam-binding protein with PASTA domain